MNKYPKYVVVVTEEITTGFAIYGPFDEYEDALSFGEDTDEHWWIVRLLPAD
jgi:hypothetical protein